MPRLWVPTTQPSAPRLKECLVSKRACRKVSSFVETVPRHPKACTFNGRDCERIRIVALTSQDVFFNFTSTYDQSNQHREERSLQYPVASDSGCPQYIYPSPICRSRRV